MTEGGHLNAPAVAKPTAVKAGDGGRPLYCVPPVSGSLYWSVPLSRLLPREMPVYAFEAPGLSDDSPPLDSIAALAAAYLGGLHRTAPGGPFVVAGYSMGGAIAYEMAVQMAAATGQGPPVVLIDTALPEPGDDDSDLAVVARFITDVAGASRKPPPVLSESAVSRAAGAPEELWQLLSSAGLIPPRVDVEIIARRFGVFRANMRAYLSYQPSGYAGEVVLIQAAGSPDSVAEWQSVCRGRAAHLVVPGDHHSIWFPPHINQLAGAIVAALGR